jgi:tRNA pseudouridine55 synthase
MPKFILIDKPAGITSHDVVGRLRRITGERRIGHAGTLDPFATGLLILGIGREATRELDKFLKLDKEYVAALRLDAVSDTADRTGKITELPKKEVSETDIKKILKKFTGEMEQIPPMFSAKKINGKKMYELARKGIEVKRQPVKINIYDLEFLEYSYPILKIRVRSSSGTYIRTLAEDIGRALGSGAYLEELRRTKIGPYDIKDAHRLEKLAPDSWIDKCANLS